MQPPKVKDPLFILDYDGTLAPIAATPEAARPHPEAAPVLMALARRHPVFLVTGRRLWDLERLLPVRGLPAFGVHGMEYGVLFGQVQSLVPEAALARLEYVREGLPELPGLRVEDKGPAIALHFRGVPDEAAVQAALEGWAKTLPEGLEALWGKKVLEVRPRGFGKGRVAKAIAARHPERTPVVIGDDATDEEMFQALPDAITIKVGEGPTAARYRLKNVDAVIAYLKQYLEQDEEK